MITNSRNRYLSLLLGLLFVVSAVFIFTPILKAGMPILGLGIAFVALSLSQTGSECYRINERLVVCIYLYIILCCFYKALSISSVNPGTLALHLFFFISVLLLALFPHRITTIKDFFFLTIVFVILYNIVDNIRLCLMYPELYVLVNRDMDPTGATLNIGASKFYNAVCFFNMVCFFGVLNCKEKKIRIILFLCVLLSCIFVFAFCLKASVIVFTGFSIVLLFLAKRAKNFRQFTFRILVPALLVYAIISLFSNQIIELMTNVFSSQRLVARLSLLIDSDSVEATRGANTIAARENLWQMSVDTWTKSIDSFVFGIGDHRANWAAGQSAADTGIGQHSDFLDSLARYGLVGVFIMVPMLYMGFKRLITVFDKEYRLQLFMIVLIFMLFGFTKAVFQPDIGFLLFIFLPMISKYVNMSSAKFDSELQ